MTLLRDQPVDIGRRPQRGLGPEHGLAQPHHFCVAVAQRLLGRQFPDIFWFAQTLTLHEIPRSSYNQFGRIRQLENNHSFSLVVRNATRALSLIPAQNVKSGTALMRLYLNGQPEHGAHSESAYLAAAAGAPPAFVRHGQVARMRPASASRSVRFAMTSSLTSRRSSS
jgi:hypothetical protein